MLDVFIGYDKAEPVAYHTCCESLISNSSQPLRITPLWKEQLNFQNPRTQEGYPPSNGFIFSRFLVPFLMGFKETAVFLDGDMVVNGDISELFDLPKANKGVYVVKHDYKTTQTQKYLKSVNLDYPRKNWSSVIVWNCGFYPHKFLTPENIRGCTGEYLHRFQWLNDDEIGELPKSWNVLSGEPNQEKAERKLIHYTLGTPCFNEHKFDEYAEEWHGYHNSMNHCRQVA